MSSNLLILIVLGGIALIFLFITLAIFNKNREKNRKISADEIAYTNDQIYVGNLPYRVDEQDLQDCFSRFGEVQGIRIVRNFKTGRSKGYAFITYASANQAAEALRAHGSDLYGRSLVVRIAKPRPQHQHAY